MAKKKELSAEYIVGIDLGTTNCTVSYASLKEAEDAPTVHQLPIPQVVAPGTQQENPSLPSFLYLPLEEEAKAKTISVDWAPDRKWAVGVVARERGGQIPDRLVSSAKSWLCHDGIDRRAAILPQGNESISPVQATTELLQHLKEVWDAANPEALLSDQQVVVTVPASFDPSARQLVQEAIAEAGYPEVALLEEPLAAVYAWLEKHESSWRDQLKVDDQVLVVDVGGGTTDFSLVKVVDQEGDLGLERVAVGAHLLLGGDNMDLALAYHVKGKLESEGNNIDEWQLQGLIHSCRAAKEQLLGEDAKESVDVVVLGRGSKLIGGTLTSTLSKSAVQELIVDGFAPAVAADEAAAEQQRGGLQQVGLSYAQDPRITAQLATFLAGVQPTAVLFNGGTMKATALQERVAEVVSSWCENPVTTLQGSDLDFAVGRGAVSYGFARQGHSLRIKSGASRSYFIGIEGARPAIPGVPAPLEALCVVPFGMEEGSEASLEGREFALLLGHRARFRFFCSSETSEIGASLPNVKELEELHPIESTMDATEGDGSTVRVTLKSVVTDLGVLELWCIANEERRWKLEFDVREKELESVCS
jgi:molecular chaperone DnaK (HSP70)